MANCEELSGGRAAVYEDPLEAARQRAPRWPRTRLRMAGPLDADVFRENSDAIQHLVKRLLKRFIGRPECEMGSGCEKLDYAIARRLRRLNSWLWRSKRRLSRLDDDYGN